LEGWTGGKPELKSCGEFLETDDLARFGCKAKVSGIILEISLVIRHRRIFLCPGVR
jgi:hypothetical protein